MGPLLGVQSLQTHMEIHEIIEGDLVQNLGLERAATSG
jgi:hypothetical protein